MFPFDDVIVFYVHTVGGTLIHSTTITTVDATVGIILVWRIVDVMGGGDYIYRG